MIKYHMATKNQDVTKNVKKNKSKNRKFRV